jgi:hypothetical protein
MILKNLELLKGLQGYWNFYEGRNIIISDVTNNGNTGYWKGSTGNQWTNGISGPAGNFNGSTNLVSVPNTTQLTILSPVAVAAWVNPTVNSGRATDSTIISKQDADTTVTFWLRLRGNSDGKIRFVIKTDTNGVNGTTVIPINKWSHIVGTYDGAIVNIYFNGVLNGKSTISVSALSSTNPLSIGAKANGGGDFFPGAINDVGVWNRILTASEVTQLYNDGAGLTYPFTGTRLFNPLFK